MNGILLAGKTRDDALQIFHNTEGSAVFIIEQDAESRVLNVRILVVEELNLQIFILDLV